MYKLLSFLLLLAVAFAAPAAEPEAKAGAPFIAPAFPTLYNQPLGLYPHLAYSAPVAAYPAYPAYPASVAYNKIYDI